MTDKREPGASQPTERPEWQCEGCIDGNDCGLTSSCQHPPNGREIADRRKPAPAEAGGMQTGVPIKWAVTVAGAFVPGNDFFERADAETYAERANNEWPHEGKREVVPMYLGTRQPEPSAKPCKQGFIEYCTYPRCDCQSAAPSQESAPTTEPLFGREAKVRAKQESAPQNAATQDEQWCNGMAECLACGWKWSAAWPLNAGPLECKKCGSTDTIRELT